MPQASQSFFALLQKNVLNRYRWSTKQQLRLAIVLWIEGSYHRKRRQRRLGRLTPIEFEIIDQPAPLAALMKRQLNLQQSLSPTTGNQRL